MLTNGEIPNLLAPEDYDEILHEIKLIMREKGIFESKENIHKLVTEIII